MHIVITVVSEEVKEHFRVTVVRKERALYGVGQ